MFFIDYERFYGSAVYLRTTKKRYYNPASESAKNDYNSNEIRSGTIKNSWSLENLKSDIGTLAKLPIKSMQ